jgi:hypothetical protein
VSLEELACAPVDGVVSTLDAVLSPSSPSVPVTEPAPPSPSGRRPASESTEEPTVATPSSPRPDDSRHGNRFDPLREVLLYASSSTSKSEMFTALNGAYAAVTIYVACLIRWYFVVRVPHSADVSILDILEYKQSLLAEMKSRVGVSGIVAAEAESRSVEALLVAYVSCVTCSL